MTDTDRDLLDRAARAAGIVLDFKIRGDFPPYYINERGGHSSWNPQDDDAEAIRLAIRLNIHVIPDKENGIVIADPWGFTSEFVEEMRDDEMRATRRAIVRAAAALGDAK